MSFAEISEELINKACELSMKAHECCDESNQYLYDKCCRSSPAAAAAVFSFAGAWLASDWFAGTSCFGETKIDLCLFPCLKCIANREAALVNGAFLSRFQAILINSSLSVEVNEAVKEGNQVVFAGHGSGGPMAILAALWFLEKYTRIEKIATPRCVTFGSPLVGNHIFPHAIRREKWSRYFFHFVMRHDIIPRIMLAPYLSIKKELQQVLDFLNPRSSLYKHSSICLSTDASSFVDNVLTNVSSVASYVACNFMQPPRNLLVQNISGFVDLSPYRPFGTYIFCNKNRRMVVRNSDYVLHLLFHSSQLPLGDEGIKFQGQILKESLVYNDILQQSVEIHSVIFLDDASIESINTAMMTLSDFGLGLSAKLCLLAVQKFEKEKLINEKKIDKEAIREKLMSLQEYRRKCELSGVGHYDAFKMKRNEADFYANVVGLQLGGIWYEIVEMLKTYQLPDEFEGDTEWIELGTKLRRLYEPLGIAAYYQRGINDDLGPFMIRGRSAVFIFPQRWLNHKENVPTELLSESCFWAEVEELKIMGKKESYENLKERISSLEKKILRWNETQVLEKDVFLDSSTLSQWWKSLPQQHKSESCIRGLFCKNKIVVT